MPDIINMVPSTNMNNIPQHIAIIMDGNGRWAKERGQDRLHGHAKGVDSVRNITQACVKLGVKYLTLYSFSTENWNRPQEEIYHLMNLLAEAIQNEFEELHKNNIRLETIGDITKFPEHTRNAIANIKEKTKNNTGLTLIMALNYSSKWEIITAVQNIVNDCLDNKISKQIDENVFKNYLTTREIPDPELLIRTSGEYRVSNFLLYQLAYAELYFTKTYWPDFNEEELLKAIKSYQKRERRFGQISEQLK